MALISLAGKSDRVRILDDDGNQILSFDKNTRSSFAGDNWTGREVPTGAIAFSELEGFYYFLIRVGNRTQWIYKLSVTARTEDKSARIELDPSDADANDIHAIAGGFLITKRSGNIRYYSVEKTGAVEVNASENLLISSLGNKAPETFKPWGSDYFIQGKVGNYQRYFQVKNDGTVVQSEFRHDESVKTTVEQFTERYQDGTREERYIKGYTRPTYVTTHLRDRRWISRNEFVASGTFWARRTGFPLYINEYDDRVRAIKNNYKQIVHGPPNSRVDIFVQTSVIRTNRDSRGDSNTLYSYTVTKNVYIPPQTITRRVTNPIYGTRTVPVFKNRIIRYNQYTKIKRFFYPAGPNLLEIRHTIKASSHATEGDHSYKIEGFIRDFPVEFNLAEFDKLGDPSTKVWEKSQEITDDDDNGLDFINDERRHAIAYNEAGTKAVVILPERTVYAFHNWDISAGTFEREPVMDGRYFRSTPEILDIHWRQSSRTYWRNLVFRRDNNYIIFAPGSGIPTEVQVGLNTPGTGMVAGSGFFYRSGTDWGAGVLGGFYLRRRPTVTAGTRTIKDAYTLKQYKNIGGIGGLIAAINSSDGSLATFTAANGVLTLQKECPSSWIPAGVVVRQLKGIFRDNQNLYVGKDSSDEILVVRESDCRFQSGQTIGTPIIHPTTTARYTFNVSNKVVVASNIAQTVEVEEANGGEGDFIYILDNQGNSQYSLLTQEGKPFIRVDTRAVVGTVTMSITAIPQDPELGAQTKVSFTLQLLPRSQFSNGQPNIRIVRNSFGDSETLTPDNENIIKFNLFPFVINNTPIDEIADRYYATKLEYVDFVKQRSGQQDFVHDQVWEYGGNDQTEEGWHTNREFRFYLSGAPGGQTAPEGTYRFRLRVLRNFKSESFTEPDDFEELSSLDTIKEFTVTYSYDIDNIDRDPQVTYLPQPNIYHTKGTGDQNFGIQPSYVTPSLSRTSNRQVQTWVQRIDYSIDNLPAGVTFDAVNNVLVIDDSVVAAGAYNLRIKLQIKWKRDIPGAFINRGSPVYNNFALIVTTFSDLQIDQRDVIFAPALGRRSIQLSLPQGSTGRFFANVGGLPAGASFTDNPPTLHLEPILRPGVYPLSYQVQAITNLGINVGTVATEIFNLIVLAFRAGNQSRYSYAAVYKWTDGNGKEHFSGINLKNIRLVGKIGSIFASSSVSVNVNVDKLRITDKVPAFVEIYRSLANLSTRYRLTQIDFTGNEQEIRFVDNIPDDQIRTREQLYVNSARNSNIQPEGATTMQVFANNLAIAGMGTDKRRILISRPIQFDSDKPVEFDGFDSFLMPEDILSLKRIDNLCIIFTTYRIFIINVLNFKNQFPIEVQTSFGVVPDSKNAIIRVKEGLIFKSKNGFYMLTKSLTLEYIGANVEEFNDDTCLKAVVSNKYQELYFLLGSGKILVLNLDFKRWSSFDAEGVTDIATHQGELVLLKNGKLFSTKESLFELSSSVRFRSQPFLIESAWINVANIDAFTLLRKISVVGNLNQTDYVRICLAYDYKDYDPLDEYEPRLDHQSLSERFDIKLRRYKCSAVRVKIIGRTKRPCHFSGIGIEYGVDPRVGLARDSSGSGGESE